MDSALLNLVDCDPEVKPILGQILPKIEDLLADSVEANYQGERVVQLLRLERADNFYRGIQNIAPTMDPASGAVAWSSYGLTAGQTNNPEMTARAFDYNPRLTKSYGDKFVAVLGQRPFYNCTAEAGDSTNENDRRAARNVNLLIQMLMGQQDFRNLNFDLFYRLYKNGTVLGYVRPVTDGKKFGYYEVPNIVPQEQTVHPGGYDCQQCGGFTPGDPMMPPACQQCGAPLGPESYQPPQTAMIPAPDPSNPVKRFPKTSVELALLDGYTTTFPFNVKKLKRRECPWVVSECDRDKGIVLATWPNARKIVGAGSGSSAAGGGTADATARTVRAAAQSQTGTIRSRNLNMWTDKRIWLDSSRLELINDDATRELAKQAFPDGIYMVQIEGKTVSIRNQDFERRFSTCKPSMSDYLFTDGGCWGMLGLEDAWSNLLNIMMETLETGIARFITNPDYVDADALNRNRYSPNRFIEAIPKAGENIASNWGTIIPTSDYPQQIPETFQIIDNNIQQILGLLPQVYGQMPGNLTLGQARMMLSQGLMQLGTVAELGTGFFEESFTNMVNLYCEVAQINPEHQGESIDLQLIKTSNWNIKGNTSMPRSFSERVESLRELLTQAPQLADAMKITGPSNIGKIRDYLDMPDFDDPDADAAEALKEIIDQLWQASPIQPPPSPPDPITGIAPPPAPPQPSIPFDPLIFDPQMTVSLCRAALLSNLGQQRQAEPGYANVRAFLMAAQQAIPQPPQFAPPKLTFSAKLTDLTPEQEGATLNDFGINVPPPHPGAMQARASQQQQSQQQAQNGSKPPSGGAPPPQQQGPSSLLQPGTPAMDQGAGGMIQ